MDNKTVQLATVSKLCGNLIALSLRQERCELGETLCPLWAFQKESPRERHKFAGAMQYYISAQKQHEVNFRNSSKYPNVTRPSNTQLLVDMGKFILCRCREAITTSLCNVTDAKRYNTALN